MEGVSLLGLVLVGIAICVGLIGVILPVIPGVLLVWAAVAAWAVIVGSPVSWLVLAVATALILFGQLLKYLIPGAWMREAGVPWTTLLLGVVFAIVGFFVVPVIGLPLGFILGVYVAELGRLDGHGQAWPSTIEAVKAVGLSLLIELASGTFAAAAWLGAVIFA